MFAPNAALAAAMASVVVATSAATDGTNATDSTDTHTGSPAPSGMLDPDLGPLEHEHGPQLMTRRDTDSESDGDDENPDASGQ